MKRLYLILFVTLFPLLLQAQVKYSTYFENNSLRIDYLLGGTENTAEVFIDQMKKEPYYGGSKINLLDEKDYGTYRYRVFDLKSGDLIFSKGFCPLFQEWQTTEEASIMKRTYYQCAIIPFPKNKIQFKIEYRDKDGIFKELSSTEIDPKDYFILEESLPDYEVEQIKENGKPEEKVDLVFLPEGYTENQMDKFLSDVNRMLDDLFSASPFDKHEDDFNVYVVKVPSLQSGTDVPGEDIYRNTAFNSTFYTFGTPRYLTTKDMKSIHDAAALVPYDQIIMLVNSPRYGGGGFYNFLTVTTVDHELSEKVFVHEFGHAFAGLADEYYTSDVAFEDYYNLKVEPWEPNITTLVDFKSKWSNLVDPSTPIPTPRSSIYSNTIGAFEGGGYVEKGIYSPMMDCRMKSIESKEFCPVCQKAIEEIIAEDCQEE